MPFRLNGYMKILFSDLVAVLEMKECFEWCEIEKGREQSFDRTLPLKFTNDYLLLIPPPPPFPGEDILGEDIRGDSMRG